MNAVILGLTVLLGVPFFLFGVWVESQMKGGE